MKYICLLFLVILYYAAYAGVNGHVKDTTSRLIADTDTVVKKQSLSAGISYGSDAIFFGRTSRFKYPFFSGDVIYNAKSGWFVYSSVIKVIGSIPGVDETDLGAGYIFRFGSKFSSTASYTRFFFDKDAEIIKSTSTHDINVKNTYDFSLFKSSITLDYLFGRTSDIFLTLNAAKHFETNWSVFDDKDYLSFDPAVNFILGTQNFVASYDDNHHREPEIIKTTGPVGFGAARVFDGLNYSFKIPVAYNRPHYTFEASYKYSVPINVQGTLVNHKESFLNLTFYYVFY